MLTITRKPLGMWLVAAFALGASLLTSVLIPTTAHAALAATWVDKNTITIASLPGLNGTVTFKGPSTETLPYTASGAPAKFQVFSYGGGQWIIYFPDGTNLNTATSATYRNQNDPLSGQTVTFAKTLQTVIASPTPSPTPTPTDTAGTPTPVCDVGGLSFLLCPLINLVEGLVRTVGDIIGSMMNVNPLPLSGGPVFNAWSNVLNIANVVLAIAFLFVIFAQATSMALSSYSIKRMLPKIIAAAILMNLSYYICAFAIDLSNLAGNGITSMFMTVSAVKGPDGAALNSSDIGGLLSGVVSVAVTAIAIAGIVAVLLFVALVPTTIAILAVLFVLAARQAIIILLVMIAPLAFALWVLPNTEKYFKKWWEWFMQMLVLYPMVMALFAAAIVASNVIAQTTEQPKVDDFNKVTDSNAFKALIALIVMALPLFALPALFKASGNVLGRLHTMTNGGIKKYGGNQAHDLAKHYRGQLAAKTAANTRPGIVGKTGRFVGGYSARRNFKMNSQKANAERLQQEAISGTVLSNDRFAKSASGIAGGPEGIQRAQASAVATVLKHEQEEAANRVQLLGYGARQSGQDVKDYVRSIMKLPEGTTEYSSDVTHYKTPIDHNLLSAIADYSAANGEIPFLEDLRRRADVDQVALDETIRRNDGTIKSKGGFHLATDFTLAHGRGPSDIPLEQRINTARLEMLAGSSAMDVGSMKHGEFGRVVSSLTQTDEDGKVIGLDAGKARAYLSSISDGNRKTIATTLSDVLNNPQARANAGDRLSFVVQAAQAINSASLPDVQVEISAEDVRRFGFGTTRVDVDDDTGDAGSA